jgi:hypothetical protein
MLRAGDREGILAWLRDDALIELATAALLSIGCYREATRILLCPIRVVKNDIYSLASFRPPFNALNRSKPPPWAAVDLGMSQEIF